MALTARLIKKIEEDPDSYLTVMVIILSPQIIKRNDAKDLKLIQEQLDTFFNNLEDASREVSNQIINSNLATILNVIPSAGVIIISCKASDVHLIANFDPRIEHVDLNS